MHHWKLLGEEETKGSPLLGMQCFCGLAMDGSKEEWPQSIKVQAAGSQYPWFPSSEEAAPKEASLFLRLWDLNAVTASVWCVAFLQRWHKNSPFLCCIKLLSQWFSYVSAFPQSLMCSCTMLWIMRSLTMWVLDQTRVQWYEPIYFVCILF